MIFTEWVSLRYHIYWKTIDLSDFFTFSMIFPEWKLNSLYTTDTNRIPYMMFTYDLVWTSYIIRSNYLYYDDTCKCISILEHTEGIVVHPVQHEGMRVQYCTPSRFVPVGLGLSFLFMIMLLIRLWSHQVARF